MPHQSKTYADCMNSLKQGRGLWCPEPDDETGPPELGDVGYFTQDGGFCRLFNVTPGLVADDTESFVLIDKGFTDGHLPNLEVLSPPPIPRTVFNALSAQAHISSEVKIVSGGAVVNVAAGVANIEVEYRCDSKKGAIMELRTSANRTFFKNCDRIEQFVLRNYHKQWQPLVDKHLDHRPDEPIVFVNGHMRTKGNWTLSAFHNSGTAFRAKAAGQSPGGGGGFHATKEVSLEGPVFSRSGRLLSQEQQQTGGDKPQDNTEERRDTLFVKYYLVKKWPWQSLKAGAGPHHIAGDRNPDVNVEGITLETSENDVDGVSGPPTFRDPLECLLDHILKNSGAETAIGCSDDLYLVLPNNEWPSDLEVYLNQLRPVIHVTDEKVGSISVIDAIQKKRRRAGQRHLERAGADMGEEDEGDIPGRVTEDKVIFDVQPRVDAGPKRPHVSFKPEHKHGTDGGTTTTTDEIPSTITDGEVVLGAGPHMGVRLDWPHMTFRHNNAENGSIASATISPDGKLLAVAWDDVVISLWTLSDGSFFRLLQESGHSDSVYTLAFSPDSTHLISGSLDCNAIIWSVENGAAEHLLSGHTSLIMAVEYSPDGRLAVTGSDDSSVKVWDPANGNLLRTLNGHDFAVRKLAFAPDGTRLASCADAVVALWDSLSGEIIARLVSHNSIIHDLAFSHDGERLITGSEDGSSCVWDATTGAELVILHEHTEAVLCVAFSPDDQEVVSGSHDATITSCDSFDGSRRHTFDAQGTSPVKAVAYSMDGDLLASGYEDGSVRLWDAKSGASLAEYRGHGDKVWHVEFTLYDEDIMSFADDGTVRLWNVTDTLRLM